MATCLPPGQVFTSGKTMQAFGELVERIVQADYCRQLAQALSPCALFIPPSLGGARTEFFDEDAGVHRCALLASYLKFHNAHVNEQTIVNECLATNPKPLKVKVPDIISHRFARMEFYEIKPNSGSGQVSGAEKIAWFKVLCTPMVANLPYKPGTQYKPNFTHVLSIGNGLGAPFQVGIHIFWATDGLILWEICPVTQRPRQSDKCTSLMRAAGVAALVRYRSGPILNAAALEALIPQAESLLQRSVGRAFANGNPSPNLRADVMYVQFMLNDWRARNGRSLIAEDGIWVQGGETDGAIRDFQTAVTGIVDGRIDPGGPAMRALEADHLRAAFAAVDIAIAQTPLPEPGDETINHDTDDEGLDDDSASDPIAPTDLLAALAEEVRGYLRLLY